MKAALLSALLLCGCGRDPNQRFVIIPAPAQAIPSRSSLVEEDAELRAFLLDTKTGESWCMRALSRQWVPIPRLSSAEWDKWLTNTAPKRTIDFTPSADEFLDQTNK